MTGRPQKPKRYPEAICTERQWVERYAESVEPFYPPLHLVCNRRKLNKLEGNAYEEYEQRCIEKTKQVRYRAWKRGRGSYCEISLTTYKWAKETLGLPDSPFESQPAMGLSAILKTTSDDESNEDE